MRKPWKNDIAESLQRSKEKQRNLAPQARTSSSIGSVQQLPRSLVSFMVGLLTLVCIGFDHVACVTEMHLHAVLVGALDIHVSASTVLQDPLTWLKLIERHSVTHSFAPNFFVGALNSAMDKAELNYDISSLRTVVSGGEANVVSTGITFNNRMHSMGAPANTLVPAFGMTEV